MQNTEQHLTEFDNRKICTVQNKVIKKIKCPHAKLRIQQSFKLLNAAGTIWSIKQRWKSSKKHICSWLSEVNAVD